MKKLIFPILLSVASSVHFAQATIVEFQTSHGNFKVNLHDDTTPITVSNFLDYVNSGKYDNTIIHRTVDDFVIQGGGAKFEGTLPPSWIEAGASIKNEPVYSNVKGTIAMAKQSAKINSATSQWFINTKNNASVLDPVDIYGGGAYAVFGEVIEDGMNVVNAISEVPRCNTGHNGFKELPMPDYQEQCDDENAVPGQENFVTIYQVVVYDSSSATDSSLTSTKNTLYQESLDQVKKSNNSGGGSFGWLSLLVLTLPVWRRK